MIADRAAKVHRRLALYEHWCSLDARNRSLLNSTQHFFLLCKINDALVEQLLDGYVFKIGHRLGEIYIRLRKRKIVYDDDGTMRMRVDWARTRQMWRDKPHLQEKLQYVYFTPSNDPVYYYYFWNKNACLKAKKSYYTFTPTQGPLGSGRKITRRLEIDPFAHLNFKD